MREHGGTGERVLMGARPTVGTGVAARAFAEDVSALVRAEVELAKAEVTAGMRQKAVGAALMAGAGALAFLGVIGLLVTIGLVLSEVAGLPGWASALIVSGVLLLIAVAMVLVGRSKLAAAVDLDVTKRNVREDMTWARERLKT